MSLKIIKSLGGSLLFRLTLLYTLAFTLLAILSFAVFYYRIYSVTMERTDEELLGEINYYSQFLAESGLAGLQKRLIQETDAEDPEEEFYRLINFNGEVLTTSDMSAWGSVDWADVIVELKTTEINHIFQTVTLAEDDETARVISAVIGQDTILQIGESLEEADEYLGIFLNLFSILTGVLIIASAFIGWYLARRALTDMADVTRTAEDISRGEYDRRVEVKGQFKEIDRLGMTFNHMLDRIQILLRSMKEINDNIAHDLRSPLARIRGIAEMTLTDDKSMSDYKEMAINTIEECDSLIEMINTMLEIAQIDSGLTPVGDARVDMVELAKQAVDLFGPVAEDKHQSLEFTPSEPHLEVQGSRNGLQRMVANLLDNAIKFTPAQGHIQVSLTSQDSRVVLQIQDNGIGIEAEKLPHIFERFYRGDMSRSAAGNGLGLSLARATARSHKGDIHVTSTPRQGSTFTVTLPLI